MFICYGEGLTKDTLELKTNSQPRLVGLNQNRKENKMNVSALQIERCGGNTLQRVE